MDSSMTLGACKLSLFIIQMVCHLCKDCPFTRAAWNSVNLELGIQTKALAMEDTMSMHSDATTHARSGHLIYLMRNIWKERK